MIRDVMALTAALLLLAVLCFEHLELATDAGAAWIICKTWQDSMRFRWLCWPFDRHFKVETGRDGSLVWT